jgi:hypothetical protein
MRNRLIFTGLMVAAGLLVGPAAQTARAQWDRSGNEETTLPLPIGAYQHDGSGIFTAAEFILLSTPRNLGNQPIAYRGLLFNTGLPGNGGTPTTAPGGFLGSREVALNTEDLGRTSWNAGYRLTVGYRTDSGTTFSLSWLHLFGAKYSGGAGPIGPNIFNPGRFSENTFLTSPVYNFSQDFVGRNPFPNPPFFANPTTGIWNGATDMTIMFTQRYDNWDAAGRFPVYETENARSYAIAGGRFSWLWERFEWRTVKPELVNDGVSFQFAPNPDSTARYVNTLSQRMYGPMVGFGHEVNLYSGRGGAFGFGFEGTAAALLNVTKERAKYKREDEATQAKRSWGEFNVVPNANLAVNLSWQPVNGMQFKLGYNMFNYFNTYYMQEPVSFNVGAIDPAYGNRFWRVMHGFNVGMGYTW